LLTCHQRRLATTIQDAVSDLVAGRVDLGAGTQGNPGARLGMQIDGNLVLYSSSNSPRWASNTPREQIGTTNCFRLDHPKSASGELVRLLLLARLALPALHVRSAGSQNVQVACWLKTRR
jgi:hypothetical protein